MTTLTDTTKSQRLADGDTVVARLESVGARRVKRHWSGDFLRIDFFIYTRRLDLVHAAVKKALQGTTFEYVSTTFDVAEPAIPMHYYTNLTWRIRK